MYLGIEQVAAAASENEQLVAVELVRQQQQQ
jgi:hypothetical protein